jgi:hypothetical protein
MKSKHYLFRIFLFAIVLLPVTTHATTVYLQDGVSGYAGTTDADINTNAKTTNTGSATTLRLGSYGDIKSILKFSLSSIPAGSTINSATLNFYVEGTPATGGGDSISIYKVLNSWTESGANWNSLPDSAFASTPEATPSIGYTPSGSWVSVTLTSLTQSWYSGATVNNGVMISTTNGPQIVITSSESKDTIHRPKLVVDYTPPVSANATFGINGTCGGSNGTVTYYMPSVGLCSAGTPTTVSGKGPWTWSCTGINSGTTASCSATKAAALLPPTVTLTATTTTLPYNGTTTLTWSSTGATDCNLSSGQSGISGTTSTGNLIGSTVFTITCSGPAGNITKYLPLTVKSQGSIVSAPVNGVCASSNGGTFSSVPTTNLCYVGSVTAMSGNGPWTWICSGSNGGISANCSANKNGSVGTTTTTTTTATKPVTSEVSAPKKTETKSVAPLITRQLRLGSENDEVLALQKFFEREGYLPVGSGKGYFGYGTLKALRTFQCEYLGVCSGSMAKNGYGVTGPATRAMINAINAGE